MSDIIYTKHGSFDRYDDYWPPSPYSDPILEPSRAEQEHQLAVRYGPGIERVEK